MNFWDYVKRAIAELKGSRSSGGKKSRSRETQLVYLSMAALACLIAITGLGAIVWSSVFLDDTKQAEACAFRIPRTASIEPAVPGDAAPPLDTCVTLERVETPSARALGLSNRESLPRDRGMLFDYQVPGRYCMWMKDMNFSLDMMWLNEDAQIVAIREDITPDTYPTSFCGPGEAVYVIEVNAGIVEAADLRVGQRLRL